MMTGGRRCMTCAFPRRAELEAECKEWNEMRRTGVTGGSWKMLHQALRRELGYPSRYYITLMRHLETCLGWTLS